MHRVLIADQVDEECTRILKDNKIEVQQGVKLTEDEFVNIVPSYNGIIVRSGIKVTKKVIDAGRELKIIGRAGVGVDNIDVKAATEKRIFVVNVPHGNVTAAAEHTMALMLALAKNVVKGDNIMRHEKWDRKFLGVELAGKTLGIIGFGKVGSKVARTAMVFGMRVQVFTLSAWQSVELTGFKRVSLDELLKTSDFIAIHTVLTDQTRKMIGEEQLKMMKPTMRIINTSRGGVIDEDALYNALVDKTIAGAALDVFESEPPKDYKLARIENVVLTPHLAANTVEAQFKCASEIAQEFVNFFKTGTTKNAVNKVF